MDPIRDGSNWFAYVNNDPVNYIDLWGLDTFQIGGSVAGGAGTGGTIGGGIVVSWNPSDRIVGVGFYGTYGMGSHMGTSGSLTLDISTSKNNTTKEVGGQSLTTGGGVSVGPSLSAEISVSLDGAAPIKTVSIGKGIGGSDVHSYYTYTSVSSIEINVGKALDVVKEFISTTITAVRSWGFGGKSD